MSLLIFAILVILVAALLVWLVDSIPVRAPFGMVLRVLIIIGALIVIAGRAGWV